MSVKDDAAFYAETPPQFGDSVTLNFTSGSAGIVQTLATNLVRWQGHATWDARAWRIYLGPWEPQPNIPVGGADARFVQPTMWSPTTAGATRFASMQTNLNLYARVTFGAGGTRHIAWVDWPVRGSLFQVSGSYIQVDVQGYASASVPAASTLPTLMATLGPEPGGGDSAAPGTFTYPAVSLPTDGTFVFFETPPFARAYRVLAHYVPTDANNPTSINIVNAHDATLGVTSAVYQVPFTGAELAAASFPVDKQTALIAIQQVGGTDPFDVRITVQFELDL